MNVPATNVREPDVRERGGEIHEKEREQRDEPQEQEVVEGILGESGADLLAERAHAAARGVGEEVARGEKHERRADRRREHDEHRAGPAAEDEAHRQRKHEAARQAQRRRGDVRHERDRERRHVVLVREVEQRIAVRLDRVEAQIALARPARRRRSSARRTRRPARSCDSCGAVDRCRGRSRVLRRAHPRAPCRPKRRWIQAFAAGVSPSFKR